MGAGQDFGLGSNKLGAIMGRKSEQATGMLDSLQKQASNIGAPQLNTNDPASMNAYAAWLASRGRNEEALAMKNQAHQSMMQTEQQRKLKEEAKKREAALMTPIDKNPLTQEVALHKRKVAARKALHEAGMSEYVGAVTNGNMKPEDAHKLIEKQRGIKRTEGRQDAADAKGPTLTSEQKVIAKAQRLSQIDPAQTAMVAKTLNDPKWADNQYTAELGISLLTTAIKAGEAGGSAEIPNPTTSDKKAVTNTLFGEGADGVTVLNGILNDTELSDSNVQDAYRIAAEQAVAHIREKYNVNSTTAAKEIQDLMAKWGDANDTVSGGVAIDPAKLYEDVVAAAAAKYGGGEKAKSKGPKVGDIVNGFKYEGGDLKDPSSWSAV